MSEPTKPAEKDAYWWTPWAVLVGLVVYGLLGYLGVLSGKKSGPTAADVPTTIASDAPAASAPPYVGTPVDLLPGSKPGR